MANKCEHYITDDRVCRDRTVIQPIQQYWSLPCRSQHMPPASTLPCIQDTNVNKLQQNNISRVLQYHFISTIFIVSDKMRLLFLLFCKFWPEYIYDTYVGLPGCWHNHRLCTWLYTAYLAWLNKPRLANEYNRPPTMPQQTIKPQWIYSSQLLLMSLYIYVLVTDWLRY